MNRIEQLREKQVKELADLERCELMRAKLPGDPRLMVHSGKVHAYYKAKTLAEALTILRAFEPYPFVQLKGTFLHHKPLDWIKESYQESATSLIDCRGAMLTVDGGKGFGPTAKFQQWSAIAGEVIEVSVELGVYPCGEGFPLSFRVHTEIERDGAQRIIAVHHRAPKIVADLPMVKWASGSKDAYQFSWVWCERETFDLEMARHAH